MKHTNESLKRVLGVYVLKFYKAKKCVVEETSKFRKKSMLLGTWIQIQMLLYSQSATKVPFVITSVISKSPHSSWDQKVEMGLCLLGAPKHENMFVCPHLLRLSGGLTFQKSPQRPYEGTCAFPQTRTHLNPHQAERFLICLQSFKKSFSALASFILPSHKHTYYIYSGSSFIMSLTLRKKCQHKYEYLWKQNMTLSPQKALEDCRDVSKDAV